MYLTIFITSILFFLSSCCLEADLPPPPPKVLVSLPPYAYFVKRIAEETVQLVILAPQGSDPHTFDPSAKLTKAAVGASLWIRLNEPFEKKILHALTAHPPILSILDLTKDMSEEEDQHIWMSPKLAAFQAKSITEELIKLQPSLKNLYQKNLKAFLEELEHLDQELHSLLDPLHGKTILTSHSAFGYFCKEYDLNQLAIECEGKEPLPQHLSHILNAAKASEVKVLFLQPQHSDKGARLIAKTLKIPTETIDPYSADYPELLRQMAHLIKQHND